jgi:TolA-binding protein
MRSSETTGLRGKLEPPWDDLREWRVLASVLEKRRQLGARRRRTWVLASAAALVVAALVVFGGVKTWHRAAPTAAVASASAPGQSTIALADGSTAVLAAEASVQIDEQRPDRVHLVQKKGSVRYEVRPDPSREFVVSASDTVVRVRGTAFTVDIRDGAVEVDVQRGRVEVTHAGAKYDLGVGESVRVVTGLAAAPGDSASAGETGSPPEGSARAVDLPAEGTSDDSATPDVPTAAALEAQADEARLAGDNGRAATALERLVALHPRDPRVPAALFTLGRVERTRGMTAASARAFDRCYAAAPAGPLAQDALAEAAQAWSSAGNDEAARRDATKYLRRWPQGAASARMTAISQR